MTNYDSAWAKAQALFHSGWKPQRLLADNTKLVKGEKLGWRTLGLSLAPADVSGYEVCASRSEECTKHCIFTSGKGVIFNVMAGRIFRTVWYFEDRAGFMDRLYTEIDKNRDAAIRLNVFSDLMWERKHRDLFEEFRDVQFYDYTKHFKRMFHERPSNYHLTFSLNETNAHGAQQVLQAGFNVAAVTDLPSGKLWGFPVIDGDEHDLRFLDPHPVVVGLRPKGSLKSTNSEMIYAVTRLPEAA